MDIRQFQFPEIHKVCFNCAAPIEGHAPFKGHRLFYINVSNPNRFELLCDSCQPREHTYIPGHKPFEKIIFADEYGCLQANVGCIFLCRRFRHILSLMPLIREDEFRNISLFYSDWINNYYKMEDLLNGKLVFLPGNMEGWLFRSLNRAALCVTSFWKEFVPSPLKKRQINFWGPILRLDLIIEHHNYNEFKTMQIAHIDENAWYVLIDKFI